MAAYFVSNIHLVFRGLGGKKVYNSVIKEHIIMHIRKGLN